jgi:conflict system STAND superfamily ATPase
MPGAERDANPYVGPRPFERGDAGLFYGRDREARELAALVLAHRAVLLLAASGAGKSSLLDAGTLPLLEREEGFVVLPVTRVRASAEPRELEAVPNVFVHGVLSHLRDAGLAPGADAEGLPAFLAALPHELGPDGQPRPRVLVIDQAEELFTTHPERWADREGLVDQLVEALEADPLLRVVLAVREDHVAHLDALAGRLLGGPRPRFRLEPLGREAALRAITGPAAAAGRPFAPGVAERLADDLLAVRVEAPGRGSVEVAGEHVEPVQLQVTCRELWAGLPAGAAEVTAEHLSRFGDVDEVLGAYYDEAAAAAAAAAGVEEARLRPAVERALLTPGGTRGTAYRGEAETGGIPNASVDELERRHLVRAEYRAGGRWYELTHDRLIDPVRTSNRAFARARARRRRRRLALAAAGLGVLALGVIIWLGIALGTDDGGPPPGTPIVIRVPPDIRAQATGPRGAVVRYEASAPGHELRCRPRSGARFPLGTTRVRCEAHAGGRTRRAGFLVTVSDTPVITVPPDLGFTTTSPNGLAVEYPAVSARSAVDGPLPVTCDPPSGTTFPLGETEVTCSARSGAGVEVRGTFGIDVRMASQPPPTNPTTESVPTSPTSPTSPTTPTQTEGTPTVIVGG